MIKILRLANGTELPLASDFSGKLGRGLSARSLRVTVYADERPIVFELEGPLTAHEVEELLEALMRGAKERLGLWAPPSPAQELHELMQRSNWTVQESNRVRVLYALIEKEKSDGQPQHP